MSSEQQTAVKCPVPNCREELVHHETPGEQAAGNPLVVQITKHVYECSRHGFFAYLGNRTFRPIQG